MPYHTHIVQADDTDITSDEILCCYGSRKALCPIYNHPSGMAKSGYMARLAKLGNKHARCYRVEKKQVNCSLLRLIKIVNTSKTPDRISCEYRDGDTPESVHSEAICLDEPGADGNCHIIHILSKQMILDNTPPQSGNDFAVRGSKKGVCPINNHHFVRSE